MPTTNSSTGVVVNLKAGDALAVSTTGECFVDIVSGAPGAGYTSIRILSQFSRQIGPFTDTATVRVRALGGEATYNTLVQGATTGAVAGTPSSLQNTWLPNFSKAMAALAAGVDSAEVAIISDSLGVGQFAESTTYPNAAKASLAKLLAGLTGGTDNGVWGGIQLGSFNMDNFLASDPRVTQGAGQAWQTARIGAIVYGSSFSYLPAGVPVGAPLTFTPDDPWDTVDIHYISNTSYGTCAVTGAVTGTITSTGALGLQRLQLTKTQGAGSVTITPTNENHIVGINCYSRSVPRLNFLKFGVGSSTVANWIDNTAVYKAQQALQKYMTLKRPHLWLVQLGTNDMVTSVAVADYKTNLQTLITNLKRADSNLNGADVVLMVPPPIPFNRISEAIQTTFRDAIYSLAETNRLLVVDNFADFVSPTYGASRGWYSTVESLHLNASGYAEVATNINKSLGLK